MSDTAVLAVAAPAAVRPQSRALVLLFAFTLFTSAFLMFAMEPMVARMVLPSLGGSPSVWNTCLVFFQAMVLAGYAYAHGATAWLGVRRHVVVHAALVVLPLVALPFSLANAAPTTGQSPAAWLLIALLSTIGLPFFVLSTSAAVLQKWYSVTDEPGAEDPYFLYTASNLGSFVALVAYPAIVEPALRLQDQARVWTAGYGLLVVLTVACAASVWSRCGRAPSHPAFAPSSVASAQPSASISWSRRIRWMALAFVPSSLLLAVTSYMATDIASFPLLWIVPLSLYLVTFIVAFSRSSAPLRRFAARLAPMLMAALAIVVAGQVTSPLWLVLGLHLLLFVALALACHGDLADDRPPAARLTEFYFWIALGGMLGGLFNALVAPLVFSSIAEYPIVLVLACVLRAREMRRHVEGWLKDASVIAAIGGLALAVVFVHNHFFSSPRYLILAIAVPTLIAFRQQRHPIRFAGCIAMLLLSAELIHNPLGRTLYASRTFFGVYRVRLDDDRRFRFMLHGTTLHGMQRIDPGHTAEPMSYYHRSGPVGQIFAAVPAARSGHEIALVGLGVGSLATYAAPAQRFTFYEIDPAVEAVARNAELFTYLRDCGPRCTVVTGDARLSLAREPQAKFDLIVVDAFSSDAIPVHLLTREAMALYLSRLAPGGAVAMHLSNRHLALAPVLARIGTAEGLAMLWQREAPGPTPDEPGKYRSEWMLLARTRADMGPLLADARWTAPLASSAPLWTDDFSNILSVLRTP
jgi:hypothetical protein